MALQTIVNLHCPDTTTFYAVAIRNADSVLLGPGSPIVDTYSNGLAGDGGWYWDHTAAAFTEACADPFRPLNQECMGQSYTIPAELHYPNRHYAIDLYASTHPAWQPDTDYELGDEVAVVLASGLAGTLTVTTAGTSSATAPTGAGADGTVVWGAEAAHDNADYTCVAGPGGMTQHWTGDMDFGITTSGGGACVPQGENLCGSAAVHVDGVHIDPNALFGNTLMVTSSHGALTTSVDADGFTTFEVDTTGVAVGTCVTVEFSTSVKASTHADAPECRDLMEKISFSVCSPLTAANGLDLTDLVPNTTGGADETGLRSVAEVYACLASVICSSCSQPCSGCSCNTTTCW